MISFNRILWDGFFLPGVFLCGGLYLLRCRFYPLRRFGLVLRRTVFGLCKPSKDSDSLSPLQAASTALASTVGTGNIVGTAQAIALGGPGALVWLWITALFGMVIKYAEILLALKFRDPKHPGGPMDYIRALGPGFGTLAGVYALFALLSSFGMGNLCQIRSGASAFSLTVGQFMSLSSRQDLLLRLGLGLVLALLLGRILAGGAKGVGRAAALLVPLMSGAFLLLSLLVLICHAQRLPVVLQTILLSAFCPEAVGGAAVGIGAREAIHWGIRRSAFSNEAGLGSSAFAHAAVETEEAVAHSFWGVFEVFADTIVICTATALVILCSGAAIPWGESPGPELFQAALATVFGELPSALFMCTSMLVFAFATVLGWSLYGECCCRYLLGGKAVPIYRLLAAICVIFGCVMSTSSVWLLSDTANALMAIPNLTALLLHGDLVAKETKKFFMNEKR